KGEGWGGGQLVTRTQRESQSKSDPLPARFEARERFLARRPLSGGGEPRTEFSTRPCVTRWSQRRLRGGAGHHIPGDEQATDQRARKARAGTPPGEGSDDGAYRQERHKRNRHDRGERHEAGIGNRIEQF